MKTLVYISALAALSLLPPAAMATKGYVVDEVVLRAGPDTEFPSVSTLRAGTHVSVIGCSGEWAWCDVVACDERGWVAGRYVELLYDGRRVDLHDYGPRIGVPIVTFAVDSYWNEHYYDQPWYERRDYWVRIWRGPRDTYVYPSRDMSIRGRSYDGAYSSGATTARIVRQTARVDRRYANPPDVTRSQARVRVENESLDPSMRREARTQVLPERAAWGQERAEIAHQRHARRAEERQIALQGPREQRGRGEHRGWDKEHKQKHKDKDND